MSMIVFLNNGWQSNEGKVVKLMVTVSDKHFGR